MSTELDTSTAPAQTADVPPLPDRDPRRGALRRRLSGWSRLGWPLAALALILLFNLFFTRGFFDITVRNGRVYGSPVDVLNRGAPVSLLALGMTLVIATGGIDLSVGSVMAITGALAAVLISRPPNTTLSDIDLHGSVPIIVAIELAAAVLAGIWNGVLVAWVRVQPIIATLILMVAGRGIAKLITNQQHVPVNNETFSAISGSAFLGLPLTVTIVAVTAIVLGLLCRATALGLFIESVGNNPTASRYAGVNARSVRLLCYTLCGLCAGIAGLIATADIREADPSSSGLYLELDAILAVSIGGTALTGGRFSLAGSLIGALVIQALRTTFLMRAVPTSVYLMTEAGVVVVVCLLQSDVFRAKVLRPLRRRTAP